MSSNRKKKDIKSTTEEIFTNLDQNATKIELFIEKYKNYVIYSVLGIMGVFSLFIAFKKYYIEPLEQEAKDNFSWSYDMFIADSLEIALNGDGNNTGLLEISDQYGLTKVGSLANYCIGMIYMKQGKYSEAIEYLDKFSNKDKVLAPISLGVIGDAFMEMEQYEDALKYYKKAFKKDDNGVTSPIYLFKAGKVCMILEKNKEALKFFSRIKKDFPTSSQASDIDKFIGRMEQSL